MEALPIKNCSSTLPPRSTGIVPSARVCRSLFGSVDHEEVKATLDLELDRDLSQKKNEWSFDFSEGTPILGGRLIWEEIRKLHEEDELSTKSLVSTVDEERRVPALHGESDDADDVFEVPKNVTRPTERNSPISLKTSPAVSPKSPTNEMKIPITSDRKRKRQRKTITDFMKQTKRRRVSLPSAREKNSKAILTVESRCAKDDLALRNSSKKVRVSEC